MPTSRPRQANYKYISVKKLKFDPSNPRFFGETRDRHQTQKQLFKHLIKQFGALGLVDSLLANGFLPYEPLVVRDETSHYSVLEGNRRLAAVKYILENQDEFRERAGRPIKDLKKLPCIIFEESGTNATSREQTYLGLRHFSGYKQWQPSSKAEYLARQIDTGISPGELAVKLNTTTSRLKKYLIAMNLINKGNRNLSGSPSKNFGKFWLLAEALQRTPIREYLALDVDGDTFKVASFDKGKFKNLCRFLYGTEGFDDEEREQELEPVISDSRQISKLAEVLASAEAREVLEKKNDLNLALTYVEKSPEVVRRLYGSSVETVKAFLKSRPSERQKKRLKATLARLLR